MAATTPSDTYALSDEQVAFRDTIRQIVRERVEPRAAEIDAKAEYPWDLRKLFAEQDLLGLPFDEEYGGTGTGTLMLNIAVEEVAKACASTALILMVQELGTLPIRLFGSDELKQRFLPKCASGEWSPAFALSEPEAGSDPGGMITSAAPRRRRVGDQRDQELDHQPRGRRLLRRLRRHRAAEDRRISAFVVEADRPGFSVGKLEHKLGIKGSPTGQPIFDDVRIPHENLIGEEGKGLSVALGTLDHSRLGVAAQAVGIAQGATDYAAAYARERKPVRQADQRVPGRSSSSSPTWRPARPPRASCSTRRAPKVDRHEPDMRQVLGDGQAVRLRHRDGRHRRGGAGARRLRLRHRVPRRALHARRQDHPDLRGHERDPAARDRPDALK